MIEILKNKAPCSDSDEITDDEDDDDDKVLRALNSMWVVAENKETERFMPKLCATRIKPF